MTLRHEILGTSLVVLVAILRCCLSEELWWVPSRVAAGTMAVAQLLALARNFAVLRFNNSDNFEGNPKCMHQMPGDAVPCVTSPCTTGVEAKTQLCDAMSCENAWFGKRFATERSGLLVFSFAFMGALALRSLRIIFGQPSLLVCC